MREGKRERERKRERKREKEKEREREKETARAHAREVDGPYGRLVCVRESVCMCESEREGESANSTALLGCWCAPYLPRWRPSRQCVGVWVCGYACGCGCERGR